MIANRQFSAFGASAWLSIGLLAVSPAAAQHREGMHQMPMYDTKAEVTLKGTVDDVITMTGMGPAGGSGMMEGRHLKLKTGSETIDVHLGPAAFLIEKEVDFKKGDDIEVVGARVKTCCGDAVLAREIRKGDATWTLRDTAGRPLWTRMKMGPR